MAYTGEKLDVPATLEALPDLATADGFEVETWGEVAGFPLYAFHRPAKSLGAPQVYVSAGVHGDEPAGPTAIREALTRQALPDNVSWTICPLINPAGLIAGTRENATGIDLNRDYALRVSTEIAAHVRWLAGRCFEVALCLHEDYDTTGFYLYEIPPDTGQDVAPLAPGILAAVRKIMPIEDGEEIDGFPATHGIITPPEEVRQPDRTDLPEALYLHFHHARRGCTLETPSNAFPLATRAAAQRAALCAALG